MADVVKLIAIHGTMDIGSHNCQFVASLPQTPAAPAPNTWDITGDDLVIREPLIVKTQEALPSMLKHNNT